jgi:type II secretory pathway component PulC
VKPGTEEAEEEKSGRLVVKGILYSEDNPSAIIDTQIVHIGDKIYGATVVKINRDSVEFEIDGKKETKSVEP